MSNKLPGNHLNVYGGVDTSSKPHLVEPSMWLTGSNMRFFNGATQQPRKKVMCKLRETSADPIVHLSAIPKARGRSLLVALSQKQIWQVTSLAGNNVGAELLRDNNLLEFNTDGRYRRWGTVMYKGHLYFTNELNSLRYTDGSAVYKLGEGMPGGRYVSNLYDHMWLAWVRKDGHTYPTRLHWSHLYDFSKWDPQATQETDFYDFEEYCSPDLPVRGITGLGKLGTSLVTYTPSAILNVRYVGLPKIVNVEPLALDIGNGLPWTLVALSGRHYFFDLKTFNFYVFTGGEAPRAIGDAIQSWLAANIKTTSPSDLETMWGFYDGVNREITWVFRTTSSTSDLNGYVSFNETTGKWTHGYCENIHAFCPGAYRARTVAELSGEVGDLTGQAADLGSVSDNTFPKMYGTANTSILREEVTGDTLASLVDCPVPVLETGDMIYGDIDKVKEVESIVIHSQWTDALNLKVEYSVRDNLEDTVTWTVITQKWTPTLKEKRLSFPRIAGRIFRFRFTPVASSNATTTTTTRQILSPSFQIRAELAGTGGSTDPEEPEEPNDLIPFKKFNGPVYHILPVSNYVYVVGRFNQYGNNVEGWQNCKGIARINYDGSLDTTFQPGGVAGGGFDITYPYFAPTQIQGAADGGVFIAMSYWNLPERRLYINRGEPTPGDFNALSLNGVAVAPLLKLTVTGAVDGTFSSGYLLGTATNPKFMSFHAHESGGSIFVTYHRDIVTNEPGAGVPFNPPWGLGGQDYAVLEKRTLAGVLTRRVSRRHSLDMVGALADTKLCHMVFADEQSGLVYWSGMWGNVNSVGGLVINTAGSDNEGVPVSWKIFDNMHPTTFPGLFVFNFSLDFHEAANWAGYTEEAVNNGFLTTMVPQIITRGCFRASLVGSTSVVGDPMGSPGEGRWTSSPTGVHKGCLHFCFEQSFSGSGVYSGTGMGGSVTLEGGINGSLRFYTPYWSGPQQFDLIYAPGTPDEDTAGSSTGQEVRTTTLISPLPSGPYEVQATGGVGNLWEVTVPAYKAMLSSPTHLWDLRGVSVDVEDSTKHGFETFSGYVVDADGCDNCRVLKAQYDGSSKSATTNTSPNLGVFITGTLEKFKNVTIATVPGQLFKLRHNGNLITDFEPPIFGPAEIPTLLTDISAGVNDNAANREQKISCASLGRSETVIYVGGKFTEITVDGVTESVGHIVCLDANTGEVLS
jgi:hypothetical protein